VNGLKTQQGSGTAGLKWKREPYIAKKASHGGNTETIGIYADQGVFLSKPTERYENPLRAVAQPI
jgi:hypothetical protein